MSMNGSVCSVEESGREYLTSEIEGGVTTKYMLEKNRRFGFENEFSCNFKGESRGNGRQYGRSEWRVDGLGQSRRRLADICRTCNITNQKPSAANSAVMTSKLWTNAVASRCSSVFSHAGRAVSCC